MSATGHRLLLVIALVAASIALLIAPSLARADGDPGSDVLLAQNLFYGANDGVTTAQELHLGNLLTATARAGAPVRVAIIGQPADLGTVGALWGKPQEYAHYLAYELSLTYSGRLLIVMPSGLGVWWWAHQTKIPSLASTLASVRVNGSTATDLVNAAEAAVYRLEGAAGVTARALAVASHGSVAPTATPGARAVTPAAPGTPASSTAARSTHERPGPLLILILVVVAVAYIAWRRGWRPSRPPEGWRARLRRLLPRGVKPVTLIPTLLLAIVLVALVLNQKGHDSGQPVSNLSNNPGLDPGTLLHPIRRAPSFTLTDETGRRVSLSQYRGKVVILSFIDSECETLCPLTTQAMLDAKESLGAAGKDVQLLGVNANWRSIQVDDVQNYTQLHGLTGHWHFLTGSVAQLERVWKAYGVNEKKLVHDEASQIDHVAATFVIDPQGREREVFTTYSDYTAIPQQGQLLAREASRLLPSHPPVHSHYGYGAVRGITPAQTATLPRYGGGSVTLGPGRPRLYLFFDTWDQQSTPIAAHLSLLDGYERSAARLGLPSLTAIDEGSVEPSPGALAEFFEDDLPKPLSYPVAIDTSGRVADGYEVQGEPWFVLTSAAGRIVWYQEVYTDGWPVSTSELQDEIRSSLAAFGKRPTVAALDGSPPPLAALHRQSAQLLGGGEHALAQRLAQLRGHPVVLNIWASWCTPCQQEFGYLKTASLEFGKQVAFLGADYDDQSGNATAFLNGHRVAYPSYQVSQGTLQAILPGGVENMPTTLYFNAAGKLVATHYGVYQSLGSLEGDIEYWSLEQGGSREQGSSP